MVWLPDGEKSLRVCLAYIVNSISVCDRQAEIGRTDRHLAYSYTSSGKNRDFRQISRFSSDSDMM